MRLLPLLAIAAATLAHQAQAADLVLKRVMLSSAGVGYFEYEAQVDGPASLGLDVKLDQVDDVLKSLVVFDDAGGVGGVELPGHDGRRTSFGNVPFGPDGLASPLAFLNSLQGVEVSVEGARPMAGRILRAEAVREPAKAGMEAGPNRTRVSLLTAAGLQQFVLEDSDAVQVADPVLRERIAAALAASRHETAGDTRHLTIRSNGAGTRTVRVSFVAAAPLWKASYRLVLPPPEADPATAKARLQGWATFENTTETDWSGVALSVQYGNPVTFRQAIYRSYFVTRPEVPVEVLGRLLPSVDARPRPAPGGGALPPPPPPPAPTMAPLAMAPPAIVAPAEPLGGLAEVRRRAMPVAAAEPTAVAEGTEETVFTIPAPVTLAAAHSASVPILDAEVPAARIGLATVDQAHPLAAIRLVNTFAGSLPAGVLTLYDAQGDAPYAGDARLGGVPTGESRLVAYAQDLRTAVEWRHEDAVTLAGLTVADGVLTVTQRNRQVVHATLTAPARLARRVLVEAPKAADTKVAPEFAQPVEQTDAVWRFAMDLRPGETRELTFALDRNERQAVTLLNDDEDTVAAVLNLQDLGDAARTALRRIATLRAEEAARTAERDRLTEQRQAVEHDEERLRANLAAVGTGDALRSRLVRQLDADETRLTQLDAAIAAANDAVTKAHQVLAAAVAGLRI